MGIVIGDFKKCDVVLKGTMNGPWAYVDGEHVTAYSRKENPYIQVKRYRGVLRSQLQRYETRHRSSPISHVDDLSRVIDAGMIQSPRLNATLDGFNDPWWYACGVEEWLAHVQKQTYPARGSKATKLDLEGIRAWLLHVGLQPNSVEEAVDRYCCHADESSPDHEESGKHEDKSNRHVSEKESQKYVQSKIEQHAAIHAPTNKHLIVRAAPGSGKTRVLTQRAMNICALNQETDYIVVITYTNKARDEIHERLETTSGLGSRYIGTIHQFALKCANDETKQPHKVFDDAQEIDVIATLANVGYEEARELRQKMQPESSLAMELHDYLERHQAVTFRSMIDRGIGAVQSMPDASVPSHVLIDEFQDITRQQLDLLLALRDRGAFITAVGDPEQAIFGFAGGDPSFLNDFVSYFPGATQLELRVNRRSGKTIVELADRLRMDDLGLVPAQDMLGEVVAITGRNSMELAESISTRIKGDLTGDAKKQRRYGDIAVLCRTRNSLDAVRSSFEKHEIPYQEEIELSEIRMIRLLHDALLLSGRIMDLDLLLLVISNMPGMSTSKWRRYLDSASSECTTPEDIKTVIQNIPCGAGPMWQAEIQRVTAVYEALHKISGSTMDERVEEIWRHVMKPYQELKDRQYQGFVAKYVLAAHCKAKYGLYTTVSHFVLDLQDLQGIDLEPDVNAVHFTTIHKAKGREWPIVIVLDVCQGIMPHYRSEQVRNVSITLRHLSS